MRLGKTRPTVMKTKPIGIISGRDPAVQFDVWPTHLLPHARPPEVKLVDVEKTARRKDSNCLQMSRMHPWWVARCWNVQQGFLSTTLSQVDRRGRKSLTHPDQTPVTSGTSDSKQPAQFNYTPQQTQTAQSMRFVAPFDESAPSMSLRPNLFQTSSCP